MPIVILILGAIFGTNLIWWRWADNRLKRLRRGNWFRAIVAVLTIGQISYLAVLASPNKSHALQKHLPVAMVTWVYLWSLLVLPGSLIGIGLGKLAGLMRKKTTAPPATATGPSRREMLRATAVAIPPLVTAGLVIKSLPELSTFRVRTMHLAIPTLPKGLEGLRIAHVSDLHVGRYTRPALIPKMVSAVNALHADLVLFTGDLIDISLKDLPRGIEAMKAIDPRSGMAIIEGNHDLIDNADEFDERVRAAGLPLLVDEAMTVKVRGESVQLLGTRWGSAAGNRRAAKDVDFAASVQLLQKQRDSSAFPILLAHHPHTFDPAAAVGFPLTLSGHTHGGQLMLKENFGFGPWFYRYWSGLYAKGDNQLVVNNGVGNWFPLRVNAPAEIIELVLHCG